jgi:hypothetical protein
LGFFEGSALIAVGVYPAYLAGGIAYHKGVGGYIFRNDRTGPDEAVLAEGMSAYDGGVSSYGGAATDDCLAVLILAADGRTGIDNVGEHHGRAQEDIVLAAYAGIDGYIVLDLTVTA